MRVWDLHPGYLSRGNLLGQHAEIHAIGSILTGNKPGYRNHPETLRWKGNLAGLERKHQLTVKEMELRGYQHASPWGTVEGDGYNDNGVPYLDHPGEQIGILKEKYRERDAQGRIPLPQKGSDFWSHHKYSVMSRSYNYYKEVQSFLKDKEDYPITQERELLNKILSIMEESIKWKGLTNVIHHLWGYFKNLASIEEKERYLNCSPEEMPGLLKEFYVMAQKYQRTYLLRSTVFADLVDKPL